MPWSVWIALVVIAAVASIYRKSKERSAVQKRGQFLTEQRNSQANKEVE